LLSLSLAVSGGDLALAAQVGPERGALVIVGGGLRSEAIFERFLELAGGREAPIVVIPTAGGADSYAEDYEAAGALRRLGARDVVLLHTTDPETAGSAEFVAPLIRARGVWFSGGRQWRLVDAYGGTRTQHEIAAVLERGGVIGGTSAGATIQGSFLARGDTAGNTEMMGDHQEGFGYLRGVAIDQHLLRRNRQFDLIEVIEAHPELLGIGLDEDTAIVVQGDSFEVIGSSYVAIYDAKKRHASGGRFYLLSAGDHYDLATREPAVRRGEPVAPLLDIPWDR
jgi:cyanophycinase